MPTITDQFSIPSQEHTPRQEVSREFMPAPEDRIVLDEDSSQQAPYLTREEDLVAAALDAQEYASPAHMERAQSQEEIYQLAEAVGARLSHFRGHCVDAQDKDFIDAIRGRGNV